VMGGRTVGGYGRAEDGVLFLGPSAQSRQPWEPVHSISELCMAMGRIDAKVDQILSHVIGAYPATAQPHPASVLGREPLPSRPERDRVMSETGIVFDPPSAFNPQREVFTSGGSSLAAPSVRASSLPGEGVHIEIVDSRTRREHEQRPLPPRESGVVTRPASVGARSDPGRKEAEQRRCVVYDGGAMIECDLLSRTDSKAICRSPGGNLFEIHDSFVTRESQLVGTTLTVDGTAREVIGVSRSHIFVGTPSSAQAIAIRDAFPARRGSYGGYNEGDAAGPGEAGGDAMESASALAASRQLSVGHEAAMPARAAEQFIQAVGASGGGGGMSPLPTGSVSLYGESRSKTSSTGPVVSNALVGALLSSILSGGGDHPPPLVDGSVRGGGGSEAGSVTSGNAPAPSAVGASVARSVHSRLSSGALRQLGKAVSMRRGDVSVTTKAVVEEGPPIGEAAEGVVSRMSGVPSPSGM
jgi:hypothetical protein